MRPIRFSKKEKGLALFAGCLTLASLRPSDAYVFIPLLVASWIACLYLAYHHQGSRRARVLFSISATAVLSAVGYREVQGSVTYIVSLPIISLGCEWTPLPMTLSNNKLDLLDPLFSTGLGQITVGLSKDGRWPMPTPFGEAAYRCTVGNYGQNPVFNVRMYFQVEVKEAVQSRENPEAYGTGKILAEKRPWADIPELDPNGGKFTFYIYKGREPHWAEITAPRTATLEMAGKREKTTVELKLSEVTTRPMILVPNLR